MSTLHGNSCARRNTYKGNDAANVEKRESGGGEKKKKNRTANILDKAKHCTKHSPILFSTFFFSLYPPTYTQTEKKKNNNNNSN